MPYKWLCFIKVTPSGFEPKSSEPESEILSIELWGHSLFAAKVTIFWDILQLRHPVSRLQSIAGFNSLQE